MSEEQEGSTGVDDPRENETESEVFVEEGEENSVDILKRNLQEVFDVPDGFFSSLKVRDDVELDASKIPTRRERLGYSWIPTSEDRRRARSVPKWARDVICPKCGAIMVPLKSKANTKFGENILYQCHYMNQNREMCLTVVSIQTGVYHMMRAGDFTRSDWDWKSLSMEMPVVIPGVKVKTEESVHEPEAMPEKMPPNPWTKGRTRSKVIWEKFWEIALRDNGEVGVDELVEEVQKIRPQDKKDYSYKRKLEDSVWTIPSWMTRRTGYTIKNFGRVLRVKGKSRGDFSMYPFSEQSYRKEFGFE